MTAAILTVDDPLDDVLTEHVTTLTLLSADPLVASHAPRFQALIADYREAMATRTDLMIAEGVAKAKAIYIDEKLNTLVDELVVILDRITKKKRRDVLWRVFFGGRRNFARFKAPILHTQLTKMSLWPGSLASSPYAELQEFGARLLPVLSAATVVQQELSTAKQNFIDFRNIGRWAQHIAKSNAERTSVWGALSDLPHQQPSLNLPHGYADLFFLHDTRRRGANAKKSAEEIQDEIATAEADLKKLRADLEEAQEREEAESAADTEEAATRAELAEATKDEEKAKERKALLQKKLKNSKKKKKK